MLAKLVRPDNPDREKFMPYECGVDPIDNRPRPVHRPLLHCRHSIRGVRCGNHLPVSVGGQVQGHGVFGLVEMLVFLGILIVGYIWIWKKGALEWV